MRSLLGLEAFRPLLRAQDGGERGALEVMSETHTVQAPDPPFCWVPVIPRETAAIITRKRMVEVMVPSSEHEKCEPPTVAGGVPSGIGLRAHGVARRVNQKGNMLKEHYAQQPAPEKATPGSPVGGANQQREHYARCETDDAKMPILPHRERIGGEVRDVRVLLFRCLRVFVQRPANMRPEESLLNVVRITLVIDKAVMRPMTRRPTQRRFLNRRRSKEEIEELHKPMASVAAVGVVVMVASIHRQAGTAQHEAQ